MNVLSLGWEKTALNVFCIAVAFMLCSFATVWIDRRLRLYTSRWRRLTASTATILTAAISIR